MDLHPKFSTWLQTAQITPGDESIRKWWTGISELPVDRPNIVSLSRLAYRAEPDPAFEAHIVAGMQKHDAGFLAAPVAVSIIAAARLAVAIAEADKPHQCLAALAVACAHASGHKKQIWLNDIATAAEATLTRLSADRADWKYLRTGEPNDNDVELLRQIVGVTAEETNILWWLLGETSRDRNERFDKIPDDVIPFVAGKELADLTVLIPGPSAVGAFADRVCRSERKKIQERIEIATAVLAIPAEWRDKLIGQWKDKPVLPLCPIAKAINQSATAHGQQWPTEFTKVTGWAKSLKLSPAQIAFLTYREFLLLKAWNESGS